MTSLRRSSRKSRSLPLILLCILTAGVGCFSQPDPPSAYVEGIEVIGYDVDLSIDVERLTVAGRASVTIARSSDRRQIPLGLNGPTVDSVLVDGERVRHRRLGSAGFTVDVAAAVDTSVIDVYYRGTPREGLYARSHAGTRIVYTDGWPHRVAGWMPGIHHPAHPAPLELTLRTDPGHRVAASGTLLDSTAGVSRWRLDASAPTYSYAFAIAPYVTVEQEAAVPITHHALPADSAAIADLRRAHEVLTYFSDLLGPYRYGALSTVEVPFDFAGMENASSAFLAASLYGTESLEEVLVHEVAHQWFGNGVTIRDWHHLWISEGVTTYLTSLYYEQADGQEAAHQIRADFAAVNAGDEMTGRPLVPSRIESPYEMLTWLVYRKGAAVMHLLRLKMGDEAFFDALQSVYRTHVGEAVSSEEMLDHFRARSDVPLDDAIAFWVYGRSLPRLITRWDDASQMIAWEIADDEETLADLPFLLEIGTGDDLWFVDARQKAVEVHGAERPTVRPVGIMMIVE